jgi:hypothetical protein
MLVSQKKLLELHQVQQRSSFSLQSSEMFIVTGHLESSRSVRSGTRQLNDC